MKKLCLLLPIALTLVACQPSTVEQVKTTKTPNVQEQTGQADTKAHDFSAHWLSHNLLLLAQAETDRTYQLHQVSKNEHLTKALTPIALPSWVNNRYPHLARFSAFEINITKEQAKLWLKHQLFVQATDAPNARMAYVQTGEVLDALYTTGEQDADEETDLGATLSPTHVSFKLWAPTATKVSVQLFDENKQPLAPAFYELQENTQTGIWQLDVLSDQEVHPLAYQYYRYQLDVFHPATQRVERITTTDPYSLSLSTNSEYSQIVNLNDPQTQPLHWQTQTVPTLAKPEDAILYEVHIRDFSAIEQNLSNEQHRGKYKAFTEQNSDGMNHLKRLKNAGLTHIHLLPAFDIGTVNEAADTSIDLTTTVEHICRISPTTRLCDQNLAQSLTLADVLAEFDPNTSQAQALVTELKTKDKYNWGYDPFHYTVPEGSYATHAEGITRIIEFREMVQHLHSLGFRVVMDVVYNHTHQARLEKTAVLDKIVPNYYQRLHPITGDIEQSTCCDNTATERTMMAKLMIDSLVTWARDYRIDGFRFDLMGHQPKAAMLAARTAVQAVDPDTYFYGEGWNFGEVGNNQQFVQASQLELAGTEIGTFTDRLRDAIRGPGISVQGNDIRRNQGLGNGLKTRPNELNTDESSSKGQAPDYWLLMDQTRIGLAGNLRNFPLIDRLGRQVTGKDIPYGSQPTGYALDPADTINYISKHDNQTLWDNNQYRNAVDLTTDERVRLHNQSLSFALLAQGIPFLHMGSEFLRSKSYLRDSYDYSDWFNRVDFSKQSNFYHIGLPPAEKDEANWPLIRSLLDKNQGRDIVTPKDISFAASVFTEFLQIRATSPLFRLSTNDEIINQVQFLNVGEHQQTGLIVMHLTNGEIPVDTQYNEIIVIFNMSDQTQSFITPLAQGFSLHPIQVNGVDLQTKESTTTQMRFNVPAFTTAIFVNAKE